MYTNRDIKKTGEQTAICESISKMLIVEANAGTGKTTTAAMKIARMIEKGIEPSSILALTYTEPAVQAFYDAFARLGIKTLANKIRINTFEDFCAKQLHGFENIQVPRVKDPERIRLQVLDAISQARERAIRNGDDGDFRIIGRGDLAVEGLLDDFAYIKGALLLQRDREQYVLTPRYAEEHVGKSFTTLAVFSAYEKARYINGEQRMRHRYLGDATYDLACLFEAHDPQYTAENHPLDLGLQFVVVDEMHDTNWAMFTVIKELLAKNDHAYFLGIGDRDQVLHRVSGAESEFMRDHFKRHIGLIQTLTLSETFRFGNSLSHPLSSFAGKKYSSNDALVTQVEIKEATTSNDVLVHIQRAIDQRVGLSPTSPNSEIAVLLKNPSNAVELEHQLRRKAIKYKTLGFLTYLQRPEVLFVRLIMSAAVGLPEKLHQEIFRKAATDTWYLIAGTLATGDEIPNVSEKVLRDCDAIQFIRKLPDFLSFGNMHELADRIQASLDIAQSDNIAHLHDAIKILDLEKMARQSFVQVSAIESMLSSVEGLIRSAQGYQSISAFLRSLLAHDRDSIADTFTDNRILLASIESVKGLEYEHVIIPNVNQREFDGNLQDERNLFYVATTRTKNMLTLTHQPNNASSYLKPFHIT